MSDSFYLGTRKAHNDGIVREIAVRENFHNVEGFVWLFDGRRDRTKLYTRHESPSDPQLPQYWWTKCVAHELPGGYWNITYHTHLPVERRSSVIRKFNTRKDVYEYLYGWGSRTKHLVLTCDCEGTK